MDASAFDKLPEELKEKIRQSRNAYAVAAVISEELRGRFAICDLRVAATNGTLAVSGLVSSEATRSDLEAYLRQPNNRQVLTENLVVMNNTKPLTLEVNGVSHALSSPEELELIFTNDKEVKNRIYSFGGHDDTHLFLLMNAAHSLGIYLRYKGDSGYTTYNPEGSPDSKHDFDLLNGQRDEYGEDMLIRNEEGFDALRYYLLTGQRHPSISWREE